MKNTKVTVTVSYEIEDERINNWKSGGKVIKGNIDNNDIIKFTPSQLFSIRGQMVRLDADEIVNLNIKTKSVKVG